MPKHLNHILPSKDLTRLVAYALLLVLIATTYAGLSSKSNAQANSRFFPETGKTINQPFLKYWQEHGELAQQGYPITDSFDELNAIDGKVYKTQYFERARFEYHPENELRFQVLLGLLGTEVLRTKYGANLPPGAALTVPGGGNRTFPQTGKKVTGLFLTYWNSHGGLEQQGFPITEAYNEVNDADGKTYITQYFERARFEYHPESTQDQFKVLLGLVGKEVYKRKLQVPTPTLAPTQPSGAPTATPMPPSNPTATPAPAPLVGSYATVSHFNADGSLTDERNLPNFTTAANLIVSPSTNRLFFYVQNSGAGAIGTINADGSYTNQRDLTFDAGWTDITPLGNNRLFFFNKNTGVGTVGHFNADGSWTDERDHQGFDHEWSHIVSPSTNRLFFHKTYANGGGGAGTLLHINADGSYTEERDLTFDGGWTDITPLGNNRLFFFNRNTHVGTIGHFNADGSWTDERDHPFETLGWTHMVAPSTGRLLFYAFADGAAKIGRITAEGSYANERDLALTPHWHFVIPLGNDRMFFLTVPGR